MKKIERKFELFADFLESSAESGKNIPDYGEVCRAIGAPEKELDDYLIGQFGLGGADIVRSYRTATPIQFL
ncbi:MAG: hypothetical protein LUC24_04300 [Bacteroidales bacterium]|nr:hypothetical protein [Bacteroidales bacterium]